MATKTPPEIHKYFDRVKELQSEGLEWVHASGLAHLEQRIEHWPKDWGDDFVFLIFGDFEPLDKLFEIESLGITVFPENLKNTVIKNERTVHKAKATINDKSIASILDASRRINLFLGAFTLVTRTNCHCGWWSHITHDGGGGGVKTKLNHDDLGRAVEGAVSIHPKISGKVEAALFWIRDPKQPMMDLSSPDLLKIYAAYWNAFECLVDAICLAVPYEKQTKVEKQDKIEAIFVSHGGKVSPAFIQEAYTTVVNPGLKTKAIHAIGVCFGESADHFIDECFNREDTVNRLYDIRNSINHGEVKAENPQELSRIQSRTSKLWLMVMGMFGQLIPYPYPLHRNDNNDQKDG
ncbi:MAG: hypothetical protein MRK01_10265 [Candidatus Scalindua sp.]|nr:hypothetical protein [Candidatus Scalindua sp.]